MRCFGFILFWISWNSCICMSISFFRFGNLLASIIFSDKLSAPWLLFSPCGIPKIWIMVHFISPLSYLNSFSFFFLFVTLVFEDVDPFLLLHLVFCSLLNFQFSYCILQFHNFCLVSFNILYLFLKTLLCSHIVFVSSMRIFILLF